MLRFFTRLRRPWHPLAPEVLGERARDITFRVVEDGDIPTCLGFYRANEAKYFPRGQYYYFERQLWRRSFLTLLAIKEGVAVGCCGIHYTKTPEGFPVGSLCFGMVDPAHQRKGIGTAQLLVRLASLKTTNDLAVAIMFAVPNSVSFYRRFGFQFERKVRADDGNHYACGVLKLTDSILADCRAELERRRILYPDFREMIPGQESDEAGA